MFASTNQKVSKKFMKNSGFDFSFFINLKFGSISLLFFSKSVYFFGFNNKNVINLTIF